MPKTVTPFNKGRRQSVYSGSESVECGLCSQEVQYRNLQKHFNTKHDGATKFVKEYGVKQLSLFSYQKLPKETEGKFIPVLDTTKRGSIICGVHVSLS